MTGIIILAAGNSSRMGQPKQKLLYKGKCLLQLAIDAATHSKGQHVVVVLGAYADEIMPEINDQSVTVIHNNNWQEGMASSIRAGITELQKHPDVTGVVIMLCDQPFVDSVLIDSLIQQKKQSSKGIIACTYEGTRGVPVLFDKAYFAELLGLQGPEGAKKVLAKFGHDVATVDFPLGKIDIDTISDHEKLLY